MKRPFVLPLLVITVFFLASTAVFAAPSIPDVTGNWETVGYGHHHAEKGFLAPAAGNGTWIIKEQHERFFTGKRTYTRSRLDGKQITESFSGVITRDGKQLYLVDHDEDILVGTFLDDGGIEFILLSVGPDQSRIGVVEIKKIQ